MRGERLASSTSGGVLADDEMRDGEDGGRQGSNSKFKSLVQSESKVEGVGCDRSSWGFPNNAERSSTGTEAMASIDGASN